MKSHAAVAAEHLGNEELVKGVLLDPESSQLTMSEKALFRFVKKVNNDSVTIDPSDITALHEAGYSDEAIYYAITVCALFNFFNRWIDASGVHAMSDEAHRVGGKRTAIYGYSRSTQSNPEDQSR